MGAAAPGAALAVVRTCPHCRQDVEDVPHVMFCCPHVRAHFLDLKVFSVPRPPMQVHAAPGANTCTPSPRCPLLFFMRSN